VIFEMSVIFLSPEFFKTLCDYAKKTPRRGSAGRVAKVIQFFCIATLAVIFFSNKPALNSSTLIIANPFVLI
jgi:hypothetical protein